MKPLLLTISILFFGLNQGFSQETCALASPMTIGVTIAGDNIGFLPDDNYNTSTGCPVSDYNSAIWYSFVVPAGISSLNITTTAGTLGSNSTLTIVDNCGPGSNVPYFVCDVTTVSGIAVSICNLMPGATYYLQVASTLADEGSFTINLSINPASPTNDVCETATDLGILDCNGGMGVPTNANTGACGDPNYGGTCVTGGGVWYTFTTPPSIEYAGLTFNAPPPESYVLYSGSCSALNFEVDCTMGPFFNGLVPNTTYFLLVGANLSLNAWQSINVNTCNSPIPITDNGMGMGCEIGLSSCINDDPVEPCFGENVIWYTWTVGSSIADINISVEQWSSGSTVGFEIDDSGIAVFENDCLTLMSQYDQVNGTGFVCSTIIGNQEVNLSEVPAGTQLLIAVASQDSDIGYLEICVNETPACGSVLTNDICLDATVVTDGVNPAYHNLCANPDVNFPSCNAQSESTVWFLYDPGPNPKDVTINIVPSGSPISSPAMALYGLCGGGFIDDICGTSLELICLNTPIYIQVGSEALDQGEFDLDIVTIPSPTPTTIMMAPPGICSGESVDVSIDLGGEIGDIFIDVSPASSNDVTGANAHTFINVGSATIDDVLENCTSTTQFVIYTIWTDLVGFSCPSEVGEIIVPVYPKLLASPPMIEECLPYNLTLDADLIVTGGGSPYMSYNWLWNGSIIMSTGNVLTNYPLSESGFIQLDVIDANGCEISAIIDVIVHPEFFPIIQSSSIVACQGTPSTIDVDILPVTIDGAISSSIWSVTDILNLPVNIGTSTFYNYTIDNINTTPGTYTISVEVLNQFGCVGVSNSLVIDIFPTPGGALELSYDANCDPIIDIIFYGSGGIDIYNNGPDFNSDGIPDALDTNNDGMIDVMDILWITPSGIVSGGLSFIPTESGFYSAEIITDNNCSGMMMGIDIVITPPINPTLVFTSDFCEGSDMVIEASPTGYAGYIWTDETGDTIALDTSMIIVNVDSLSLISLEVVDGGGCIYMVTEPINSFPNPLISLSGSLTICPGDNTIINAGGDPSTWTYTWFDPSMMLMGSDSASVIIDTPGTYTSIVFNENNCSDTLQFTIDENAQLNIQISGTNFCVPDSSLLDAGSGFDSYTWTNLNGDVLGMDQMQIANAPGSYIVSVTKDMCSGIDTIEIMALNPPLIDMPDTIMICNANNSGGNTILDFDALSSASSLGDWLSLDLPQAFISNASDFSGEAEGPYDFVYTTNNATVPCVDVDHTLTVIVLNCDCPSVVIDNVAQVCNSDVLFDLNDQLLSTTDNGEWNFIGGPESLMIQMTSIIQTQDVLPGLYSFEYTLVPVPSVGCETADTLTMEIFATPEVILDSPVAVCNAASPQAPTIINLFDYLIQGNGNWINPNISQLDFSNPSNLNFLNVTPGSYMIEFMTTDAMMPCTNITAELTINVLDCACPIIDLQPLPDLCNDNGVIDLNAFEGFSDDGTWSEESFNPSSVTLTNGQLDLTDAAPGTYQFIFTLDNVMPGCIEEDLAVLQLFSPPEIISIGDGTVCNEDVGNGGTTIDLMSLVSGDPGIWTDTNGDVITGPVDLAGSGIGAILEFVYTTTSASDPCSEVSASSFIIVEDCACDDPVFLDPPTLCNTMDGVIDLQDLLISNHLGTWTITDQPSGSTMSLSGSVFDSEDIIAGDYLVEFSIADLGNTNCQQDWPFTLTVTEQITAQVLAQDNICTTNFNEDQTTYDLNSAITSGALNGTWLDQDGTVVTNVIIDFLGSDTGDYVYSYVIDNVAPCTNVDYQFILTAEECSREVITTNIYIGTVFSPNSDNLNDKIFVQSNIEDLQVMTFAIFDRWGERVFLSENVSANDPSVGWDGRFKNQAVVSGVYVYFLEALDDNENVIQQAGDITVLH